MNQKPEFQWSDPSGSLPSEALAEAIFETLVEQCVAEEDPYKVYIAHMKSQIYADPSDISHKLSDGYKSILENLSPQK